MAHIYISYAHPDGAFVDRLSGDLRARGFQTWVDRAKLRGGQDWASEVEDAISQAAVVLIIVSKSSADSNYVRVETNFALNRGTIVIPIVIDEAGRMPMQLMNRQYIDFRTDYAAGLQTLLDILPASLQDIAPLPVEPPKSRGYFFISYAEEDSDFVAGMRAFLQEKNYGYWDYQESERDYDTEMFLELERQIGQASAMFSILSPDWKVSRWAPKEYIFATETGVPTFLLMARTMGPTLVIAGVPYIDFVRDPKKGFAKLDKELRRKRLV